MFYHLWSLIHADVIHRKELWEGRGLIGVAGPAPADCHVHDDEEIVIEDPITGNISGCEIEIFLVVKIPADLILLPLDGIDMEIILERSIWNNQVRPDAITA